MTLADLLMSIPDEAVHTLDATVGRSELTDSADSLCEALVQLGLQPGQVVAAMLPNEPTTVAALFGTWRAAGVYTPLNPRTVDRELADLLETLRPAVVLTTTALAHRFDTYRECGLHVITADDLAWSVRPSPKPATELRSYDLGVALLQFTSGTTGRPKPVPLRHATVLDLIDRLLATLRGTTTRTSTKAPMPNVVPVSLSLWAGIYQILFAFRAGAGVVLMDRFSPQTFAALVARYQIKSTVLPPAALTMILQDDDVSDLVPLRIVRSITAPLSPVQGRRFKDRFGVIVLNSYGQTELGGEVVGWTTADARAFGESKLGSVGRPLGGIDVEVQADEIMVRTPTTLARKVDPAFHDRLTDDGWFHTGDLGWFDDDGFLWLDGRVSDMINRGGLKVFPGQVEDVLLAAPTVRDAAVVGVPDDRLGEVPWAFVVSSGPSRDDAALMAWCRERLTAYRIPARIVGIEVLPRNEMGKVVKRDLVALAQQIREEEAAEPPRDEGKA
ncbi:class I adenylate-forming enzyme family protein [Mycobacterium sp. RTGN5]|uniref:class I adenylate-forming enzyme family protein n=1 Tax=Mycobacterium sp. RTGN5 TaxID=3016522 RepID=UPI0029C6363E|nr:class I adenylate-forming enzyme family protein [Mycobacterium sp. RTGN5]